jgi:hypothetical protein
VRLLAIVVALAALAISQPQLRAQGPAPGGVSAGLIAWQKAEASGTSSSSWPDSSGNGNDATQGATTQQPSVVSGSTSRGINFNPGIDIASGQWFGYASALDVAGINDFSSHVVLKSDAASSAAYFGNNGGTAGFLGVIVRSRRRRQRRWIVQCQLHDDGVHRDPGIGSYVRSSSMATAWLNGGGQSSTVSCSSSFPRRSVCLAGAIRPA